MAWWKSTGRKSAKQAARPVNRLLLQALEPRMMFDGAAAASVAEAVQHAFVSHHDVTAALQRHGEMNAASPQAAPSPAEAMAGAASLRDSNPHASAANAPQVVFVESDVVNYQSLISQLPANYQVVILDSSKDGLAQIAQWAQTHSGYGAIHIISHGQENDLQLGTTELTTANVANYQAELATIGQALRPGGDILLYGCDVAEGSDGAALVNAIAQESGRVTAGSTDLTGAASLGGDWTLEYATGKLHVATLDLSGYDGLLTQPTSGTTSFDSLDGSTTVVPTGNATLTVSNYLGWNFTMNMNSNSDGQNEMIIVEKDGSSSTETVDALSNGVKQINYFSVKPNDGSLFTLNSITVVINGYDSTFNGGTMQLVGYLNGSAVAGATLSQSVSDIDNDGSPVTFNVSSNSNFVGIDSFRVIAANGHNITGLLGIGAINATTFHFPGPTLTASGGSSAYSSGNGNAVTVDSGITLSDTAASTQTSATVSITGNFHSGEDVLAFTNNGSTMGNISGSYNSGTGVLTLTSSGSTATNAQWQAALEAVTYRDSSLSPNTSTRTLSFAITDASSNTSSTVTKTVTVAADSAPVISNLNGDSNTYYAGSGAVSLDTGTAATVSDSDTSNFNGGNLTVHISANGHSGEDVLGISTAGTVTLSNGTNSGSTVSVGGVAVGTIDSSGVGSGGQDLIVDFNSNATASRVGTLVNALTFNDTAGTPNTSTRTVQVTVNDGRGGTSSASSVTLAISDAPLLTTSGGSSAFTAGDNATSTPVAVDGSVSVTDNASSTLASGTVSITGNFHSGEDALAFSNTNSTTYGNIVGSYNSGTGVLTLTSSGATATIAQWQAALRAVTYTDSALTPNSATRTISFQVQDGSSNTSTAVTKTVTVADTDQTPIATASGGSTAFTAGNNTSSTPVAVDSAITVSDLDNTTLASGTVSITGNFHSGEDSLSFTNTSASTYGNITASYNSGTGVLTLSSSGATATIAQWQAALRAVKYTDSAVTPNSATRTISFVVNDGTKNSAATTKTVTVADTDQTPIVTASGGSASFTAGNNVTSTPVTIDGGVTVSDLDNTTLASGTVSITGNFHSGEDVLAFSNTNSSTYGNISASYNSGTGVLTLTSSGATATVAQWQAAFRAVTYTDTAITPNNATRTISFVVNDGQQNSTAATRTVTVADTDQTPIATVSGPSGSYTLSGTPTPVAVDSGITVSDRDNTTLASGTVSITGNFHSGEDVLAFTNTSSATFGNIVASYNSGTGVLTLTSSGATATVAQWQAALQAVTYNDTSGSPNTATRVISFVVSDGEQNSSAVTRNIAIQLPTPTVSGLTAGTDTGSSSSDGITSDNTPTAQGTAEANSTVTIYVDGVSVGTTTASGTGAWSYAFSDPIASGSHAITAMATSGSVNSSVSSSYTVVIDTAAPSAPVVTGLTTATDTGSSSVDGITSDNTPTAKGTAEANSTVTVYIDGTAVGTTTADGSGAWVYNISSSLADGSHSIRATATDTAGNVSGQSTAYSITIDTATPSTPAISGLTTATDTGSSNSDGITSDNTPTLQGTALANSTVTVYVDGFEVGTTTANGSGAWSYALTDSLPDGNHGARVTATDTAGNVSSLSAAYSIAIDTAAPSAPTVSSLTTATDTGSSHSDGITSNNEPTVQGTAEANSTVTVYIDGTAAGTTTANGSGVWTFSPESVLADGNHSIKATATDAAGNVSGQSTAYNITIDTSAPNAPTVSSLTMATDTGSSHSDGVTSNNEPTVQGTAEANSTVTVYIDGTAAGTATANGSGAWSYNLTSSLADGNHSIRATATDTAGNVSGQSTAYNITIDTSAPNAPTVSSLTTATDTGSSHSDGVTSNNEPTVQGSAEANSTVTVYIDGTAAGTATANGSGAWSYNLTSSLADGNHSIRATATDTAGNVSGQSTAYNITVDTSAPSAPTGLALTTATDTGSSHSDGVTSNNEPTVQGTAEANSTVTVYVDGSAVGTATANSSGAWSYNLTSSLADGNHSIRATATDAAGNVSGQSTAYNITVDTSAPSAPTGLALTTATDTGSSHSDGVTSNNEPTVQGTAEANSTVTVYVDGSAVGTATANSSGVWSYNLTSSLADGNHSIRATATDAAGNVSGQSTAYNITVDTSAPSAPTGLALSAATDTGSSHTDGVTSDNEPRVQGTAEANSTVTVYVDGSAVGTATANGSGAWSYNLTSSLADGNHSIRATATDAAGNVSGQSTAYNITIDTSAPSAPTGLALSAATDTGSSHTDGVTNANQPTITGNAEANSTVTVYVDGTSVGTATANSSGAWSYNLTSSLADGNHSIRATATDAAGNVSGQSTAYNITVDTAPPKVQSFTANDTLDTTASTVSYQVVFSKPLASFDASDLTVVEGSGVTGSIASVTKVNATTYTITLSGVGGGGSLSVAITGGVVADQAGNLLAGPVNSPAYQISTPVTTTSTVTPITVGTTTTFTNTIQLPPITPNIVLAAVSGTPVVTTGGVTTVTENPVTNTGAISTPTFGTSDNVNGAAPTFISNVAANPTIALQVNPDLGVRPLVSGQSFSIALPPATIITRESTASLSIVARQSDGQPLPSWLKFDPVTGKFTGQAPAGWNKPISINIQVQDKSGHHGNSHIQLNFGQRTNTVPAGRTAQAAAGKLALNRQFDEHGQKAFLQRLQALLGEDAQA
ncbi:Ig-like domain-containing protein [Chromobacterium sp. IIBBL 290-4]|uniref:Ig-like domain-containing protein n=1 Tax=Chromobacterium sp. IIBBL 290-4 TaxID=2953890 RepID=UPI0020B89B06|nr:Ig-like domain-containing protein [Chromobacterium sp. IIBBL 290-4]UTH76148.1 Ig-like domain-containing protein [Chromobacterium sp. IIBBL 290-4]